MALFTVGTLKLARKHQDWTSTDASATPAVSQTEIMAWLQGVAQDHGLVFIYEPSHPPFLEVMSPEIESQITYGHQVGPLEPSEGL